MTLKPTKPKPDLGRAEQTIADLAAAYPEVTEDRPWGHRAFKIRGKTFLFLGADAEGLGLSVKLPESGVMALELPFTEPTHYGLGKSGWVSATFKSAKDIPMPLVKEWLDESFRAIAPKKIATQAAPQKMMQMIPPARKTERPDSAKKKSRAPTQLTPPARKSERPAFVKESPTANQMIPPPRRTQGPARAKKKPAAAPSRRAPSNDGRARARK